MSPASYSRRVLLIVMNILKDSSSSLEPTGQGTRAKAMTNSNHCILVTGLERVQEVSCYSAVKLQYAGAMLMNGTLPASLYK